MRNITLAVDEVLLEQARVYAAKRGMPLSALVRAYLSNLAREDQRIEEARRGLLELIDDSTGRLGPNYKWNRDEIHVDRRED